MTLINKSPPLNVSTPLKVNEATQDNGYDRHKLPFENDKASDILLSLTNYDLINSDKSPLKNNNPTTNILSSDNVFMNDTLIENNDPRDDLQDYLSKLRQENEKLMKNYDVKIENYEKKINNANKHLKKYNVN